MIYESSEKSWSRPINTAKNHKITNILGFNWLLKKIHSIPTSELLHFRVGTAVVATFSSLFAYYYYRRHLQAEFMAGLGVHRLNSSLPVNLRKEFFHPLFTNNSTYTFSLLRRCPDEIFNVYYSFNKAFVDGHFDHTKEILIPKTRGGVEGYDVITPFYYYNKIRPDPIFTANVGGKVGNPALLDRAAIAVHRGWIPAALRDRRLRPHDVNKVKEETVIGTLRLNRSRVNHNFTEPNNPSYGVWRNFSLEDFAYYWDLPNKETAKWVYLQEVDFAEINAGPDAFPQKSSREEAVVEEALDRGVHVDRPYRFFWKSLSTVSAGLLYMLYLSF